MLIAFSTPARPLLIKALHLAISASGPCISRLWIHSWPKWDTLQATCSMVLSMLSKKPRSITVHCLMLKATRQLSFPGWSRARLCTHLILGARA